jgi:hypothetical protein
MPTKKPRQLRLFGYEPDPNLKQNLKQRSTTMGGDLLLKGLGAGAAATAVGGAAYGTAVNAGKEALEATGVINDDSKPVIRAKGAVDASGH